jgi:hypothetical protein
VGLDIEDSRSLTSHLNNLPTFAYNGSARVIQGTQNSSPKERSQNITCTNSEKIPDRAPYSGIKEW